MTQTAQPTLQVTRTNWLDHLGGTSDIYSKVAELLANDSDYIETILDPTAAVYVAKLTSVTDPVSATGHVLRYRYRKNAIDDDVISLLVELRQGYVNESSKGTLIASTTHANLPGDAWTVGALTLSAGEANSITDYANLFVRFEASTV